MAQAPRRDKKLRKSLGERPKFVRQHDAGTTPMPKVMAKGLIQNLSELQIVRINGFSGHTWKTLPKSQSAWPTMGALLG